MSEDLSSTSPEEKEDTSLSLPDIATPYDLRPDLTEIGIIEDERGVCMDSYENRSALRQAGLNWDPVYDQLGMPTGLIVARSRESLKERRLLSLSEKRVLLQEPNNNNSDFLTGLDLIVDDKACRITPPWVIGATRAYLVNKRTAGPSPQSERLPPNLTVVASLNKTACDAYSGVAGVRRMTACVVSTFVPIDGLELTSNGHDRSCCNLHRTL